jgi:hypothetical protein
VPIPAFLLVVGLLSTEAAASNPTPPVPAPPVYVTENYFLTFRSPAGAAICPLPDDWVGSDHGTTLFLSPPEICEGAGYPSSDRGFSPDEPRIEVYYGFAFDDGPPITRHCRADGTIKLFRRTRTLCRGAAPGDVRFTAQARYSAGGPAELVITLVTRQDRLARDLQTFRAFAATARPCSVSFSDEHGKRGWAGTGAPCPANEKWW